MARKKGPWSGFDGNLAVSLLKTMPLAIVIVNREGRVQIMNEAAQTLFCISNREAYMRKSGEVFKCIHAERLEGCGGSQACLECIVRNSVSDALSRRTFSQRKGVFDIRRDGEDIRLGLLITTSAIIYKNDPMVILLVEDVSAVTQLKGLIPICASCHRIRDKRGEWMSLEKYLSTYAEVELTHDCCPFCSEKLINQKRCGE